MDSLTALLFKRQSDFCRLCWLCRLTVCTYNLTNCTEKTKCDINVCYVNLSIKEFYLEKLLPILCLTERTKDYLLLRCTTTCTFSIKMLQQCGFKYLSCTDIWKKIRTGENWIFSVLCLDSKCSRLLRIKHTDAYSMCAVLYNNSAVLQSPEVQMGCGGRGGVGGSLFLFRWILTLIPAAPRSSSLLLLEGHEHAASNICSDRDHTVI